MFLRQLRHERQDFLHRQLEGLHLRELRANVHLNSAQAEVLQLAGARIDGLDLLEGDAEFIFVGAGGDLGMCPSIDVGIHAHGDGSDLLQSRRDLVDADQLRLALDVEGIDALAQRELDLLLRLAHAREDAMARVAARRDDAAQFPAADHVEAAAHVGQRAHDGHVRVGLHRVADEVIERGESLIELAEMILQRVLGINVERRAETFHQRLDGGAFAIQLSTDETKIVHEPSS